jgi:secreted PhoX family phosphatase
MEKAAAALETRRYLGLLGGTTEFSKWEGLTFSPSRKEIYTSMSEVRYGMEDSKKKGKADPQYDVGGPNDVRLDWNPCGCVYKIAVDDNYSATRMEALVCGMPNPDTNDTKNTCVTDMIANPDNLSIMDDHNLLYIGEDASDQHENDYLWVYDLNTGNLTRILTTVYGAEVTSTYYYPSINGHAYLVANVQHPYLESDEDKVSNPYSEGGDGYIGYFTMPVADIQGKQLRFQEVPVPETEQAQSSNIAAMSVEACPAA